MAIDALRLLYGTHIALLDPPTISTRHSRWAAMHAVMKVGRHIVTPHPQNQSLEGLICPACALCCRTDAYNTNRRYPVHACIGLACYQLTVTVESVTECCLRQSQQIAATTVISEIIPVVSYISLDGNYAIVHGVMVVGDQVCSLEAETLPYAYLAIASSLDTRRSPTGAARAPSYCIACGRLVDCVDIIALIFPKQPLTQPRHQQNPIKNESLACNNPPQ